MVDFKENVCVRCCSALGCKLREEILLDFMIIGVVVGFYHWCVSQRLRECHRKPRGQEGNTNADNILRRNFHKHAQDVGSAFDSSQSCLHSCWDRYQSQWANQPKSGNLLPLYNCSCCYIGNCCSQYLQTG